VSSLIEVTDAAVAYGRTEVVRGVTLRVDAGTRVSLVGANGCGKTTLLKAICKLLPTVRGTICVDGRNVAATSRKELANAISMMAQISEQWFDFSVLDTVLMGRYGKRGSALAGTSADDVRVVQSCLRTVGMLELAEESITRLSGGQRQRVMLARAFAQQPKVIVLDEPTNHLDLKHQAELFEHLAAWVSEGERAVLQVMHDLNLARAYSDVVLLMEDGRVIADGTPDRVMRDALLDSAFGFDVREFMRRSYKLWGGEPT
jgi:iron complex transport system ATP-binding protein